MNSKPKRRPVNYTQTANESVQIPTAMSISEHEQMNVTFERPGLRDIYVPTRTGTSGSKPNMANIESKSVPRESSKMILDDIMEGAVTQSNIPVNFLSTPKRLIVNESSRIAFDSTVIKDLQSGSGMKRSNTLKDLRRHNRSITNNDSASIDSSKSKEAAAKIKNALAELDQLRKRNEELESKLRSSGTYCTNFGIEENDIPTRNKLKLWSEIEQITDKILMKLGNGIQFEVQDVLQVNQKEVEIKPAFNPKDIAPIQNQIENECKENENKMNSEESKVIEPSKVEDEILKLNVGDSIGDFSDDIIQMMHGFGF